MEQKKLIGEERRNEILKILSESTEAVPGSKLAKMLGVSRQVIVTDMALLRAERNDIIATNSGYVISGKPKSQRESAEFSKFLTPMSRLKPNFRQS